MPWNLEEAKEGDYVVEGVLLVEGLVIIYVIGERGALTSVTDVSELEEKTW